MRRLLAGLALITLASCYVQETRPPAQPGPVVEQAPTPVPPPAPATFTEADNNRWMRSLRLDVALPQATFAQGQPIFAQATLSNVSNQPVPAGNVDASDVDLALVGPQGRFQCRPSATQAQSGAVFTLAPRQRVPANLDLTGRCGDLPPGDYTLTANLALPGPWSVGAQGQLSAQARFRVEKPRQAALALVLTQGAPESVIGAAAPLQVTVTNFGDAPAHLPAGDAAVALEATDELGRSVHCTGPAVFGGQARDLFPHQSFNVRVDAALRCELTQPGTYSVSAVVESNGQPVRSNAVPLVRRAPQPRAQLQLFAAAFAPRYESGRGLPVDVRIVNQGPDAIYVFGFAPGLLHVQAFGDGRPLPCRDEGRPNPGEYGRYQLLRPGGTLAGRIDLEQRCQLSGQRIDVRLSYNADANYAGQSWNLMAFTGSLDAPPLQIERFVAPPPPQPPHVTVSFAPSAQGALGQPIVANVSVRSDGQVPATIVAPREDLLSVSAQDGYGRPIVCDSRARDVGPQETLPPGQARTLNIDLSRRCNFPAPGEYRASLRYASSAAGMAMPVVAEGQIAVRVVPGFVPPPPPPQPAHVSVGFGPPRVTAMPGSAALVNVTLTNDGQSPAEIELPREAFVSVTGRDGYGRDLRCLNNPQFGAPQPTRLQLGQSTGLSVDLARRCTIPGPGEYSFAVRYESAARAGLLPVSGSGAVQLVVGANAPPPPPPYGQPQLTVVVTPRVDTAPGRQVPVQISIRNDGNGAADIDAPRAEFVHIDLRDPNGRHLDCFEPRDPGPVRPQRLVPSQQGGVTVDVASLCRFPGSPGAYRAEFRYESRARGNTVAVFGTGVTEIDVGGGAPPPGRPGHVTVSFPDRIEVRHHEPVHVAVTVLNDGQTPSVLATPNAGFVSVVEARGEKHDREVECRSFPPPSEPALTLYPGQSRVVDVDLSQLCRLDKKGEYEVRLRYQSPPPSPALSPVSAQGTVFVRVGHGHED